MLKKHVLGGVMCVLAHIARYQPGLFIGTGQGGLMSGIMGMPIAVELAVRLRDPINRESKEFCRSWGESREL